MRRFPVFQMLPRYTYRPCMPRITALKKEITMHEWVPHPLLFVGGARCDYPLSLASVIKSVEGFSYAERNTGS